MLATLRWRWIGGVLVLLLGIGGLVGLAGAFPRGIPTTPVRVIAQYPHDPEAFCQGLVVADGQLYEGTGQYGQSSLRQVELKTGRVERIVPLDRAYFGEGIALHGDRIYQLTWKERLGIVYDRQTMAPVSSFRYTGEGWGLTTDGTHLILSDGSANLRFLSLETFEVVRRVSVHAGQRPVDKLNELEYVEGEIYANIWYSDRIARISPKTGEVLGWLDLSSLYPANRRPKEHVLNGIAYDAAAKKLYVTGKNWPRLYEIEPIDAKRPASK
jgi:glutamine cyclotransferase